MKNKNLIVKITLIHPPSSMDIETISILGLRAPPLGLAYIAAVLEKEGYDVEIIDATALDLSFEKLGNELKKRNPDIIGVTSITPTIYDAMKTVDIAKKYCPNAITIMGGCHITALPEDTLLECLSILYLRCNSLRRGADPPMPWFGGLIHVTALVVCQGQGRRKKSADFVSRAY